MTNVGGLQVKDVYGDDDKRYSLSHTSDYQDNTIGDGDSSSALPNISPISRAVKPGSLHLTVELNTLRICTVFKVQV